MIFLNGCFVSSFLKEIFVSAITVGCSHACSTIYFITSINSNKFIGIKCINYLYYLLDYCDYLDEEPLAIMGDGCSPNARGSYYLSVAAKPPYTDDDNTGTDNSISGDF